MSIKARRGRQEDILPKLEDKSVDLLYFDPPYEMNYVSNIPGDIRWNPSGESSSRFEERIAGDDADGQDAICWPDFLAESYRVLKDDTFAVMHCNIPFLSKLLPLFVDAGFTYGGTVAWNKHFAIGGGVGGKGKGPTTMKRDWEPIAYFMKGKAQMYPVEVLRKSKSNKTCKQGHNVNPLEKVVEPVQRKRISEIEDWDFVLPGTEKCGHPTQKPLALAEQMIRLMCPEKGLVLDPFAGSGTTAIAANRCQRNSFVIERDEKFFKIMKKRIQAKVLVPTDRIE